MLIPIAILFCSCVIVGIAAYHWPVPEKYINCFGAKGDADKKVKQQIIHYKKLWKV